MSKIITNADDLNKAIDAWAKRGAAWVKDGQLIALSTLQRLHDHGDIGPVNRLQVTMPRGTKSGSMAAWMLQFGALTANTGSDKGEKPFLFAKDKAERMAAKADMAGAAQCPWETCGKLEQEPDAVFDVAKALDALLARAMKSANVSSPETVAAIKELRQGMRATPAPGVAAEPTPADGTPADADAAALAGAATE